MPSPSGAGDSAMAKRPASGIAVWKLPASGVWVRTSNPSRSTSTAVNGQVRLPVSSVAVCPTEVMVRGISAARS